MPPRAPIAIRPLRRTDHRRAARLLAGAFLDDPAWVAIGPRRRSYRRALLPLIFRGDLVMAARWGGPCWAAWRGDDLVAVAVTFEEDRWPPPPASRLFEAPWLLAGPAPVRRGTELEEIMTARHPAEPHLYLWLLAADPDHQRTGGGRALLAHLASEVAGRELPLYLETTSLENVAYYRSAGYAVEDECEIPGGERMWFMRRPGG